MDRRKRLQKASCDGRKEKKQVSIFSSESQGGLEISSGTNQVWML